MEVLHGKVVDMAEVPSESGERSQEINQLIAEYLTRVDSGEELTPEHFVSEHLEQAAQLRRYFQNEQFAQNLGNTKSPATDQTMTSPHLPNPETTGEENTRDGHEETITRGTTDSETSMTSDQSRIVSSSATSVEIPEKFGRYQIRKVLGQGAMGAVYLARDTQLDRDVALKIPKFNEGSEAEREEMLARFYREARAAATLRNNNICPVYDVGEIDGQHYITMAYIEGRPLKDFTKSKKTHSEKQIITTIRKLALGLAQAHQIGVIHRDLKPANIMVDAYGEPVVMDFGLARRSSSDDVQVTQSGAILGTPAYMSPEQVEGDQETIGPQADIYALGIIMYELITGEMPFKGSLMSILQQIGNNNPTKPSELRNGLDPRLEKICLKMMAGDLNVRYRTMEDVARDLQECLRTPAKKQKQSKAKTAKPKIIPTANEESNPALISIEQPKSYAEQLREKKSKSGSKSKIIKTTNASGDGILANRNVLIAGGFGGLLLLLGIVFLVRIGKYDVQITLEDPSIKLSVDGDVLQIDDGQQVKKLSAGEHQLKLVAGNLVTEIDNFTVTKDGKTALVAKLLNGEVAAYRNGKKLLPKGAKQHALQPKPASNVRLKAGLVGHWNFEEGAGQRANDSSGRLNHGQLDGETRWQSESAPSPLAGRRSLRFEAGSMLVPSSRSLKLNNQMAFAFWCRFDADAPGRAVIKSGTLEISNGHERINFGYNAADSRLRVFRDSGGEKPAALLGGAWNHVVVNLTGKESEIWYNGRELATDPIQGTIDDQLSGFVFGQGIQGSLDDVRIYDRALNKDEIRQLANFSASSAGFINGFENAFEPFEFSGQHADSHSQAKPHFQYGLAFPNQESDVRTKDIDIDLAQPFCLEAWFDPRNHYGSEIYQRVIAEFGPCSLALSNTGDVSVGAGVFAKGEEVVGIGKNFYLTFDEFKSGLAHAAIQWTGSELHFFVNGKLITDRYDSFGHSEQPLDFAKRILSKYQSADLRLGAPQKEGSEGFLASSIYNFRISTGNRYQQDFRPEEFKTDPQTIVHYEFKEGQGDRLKDSSGHGYDGQINGAVWGKSKFDFAMAGQGRPRVEQTSSETALYFRRNADEVLIPSLRDESAALTMELWLQRDAKDLNSHSQILGFDGDVRIGTSAVNSLDWHVIDNDHIRAPKESGGTLGVWAPVHVAAVRDPVKKEGRLYVDGELIAVQSGDGKIGTDFLQICSLKHQWGNPDSAPHFSGWIDEVRISSTARYGDNFTPSRRLSADDQTVALYHFEEGHGTVLRDSSGNGHHGEIRGAKWVLTGTREAIGAWRPLFDGKSLDGWTRYGGEEGDWQVVDGLLVGTGAHNKLVYTEEKFVDHDVRMECRLGANANSGLYLRTGKNNDPFVGYEAQLTFPTSPGQAGHLIGDIFQRSRGARVAVSPEEWFQIEFRVRGDRLQLFVNGEQTAEVVDSALEHRAGYIGLQGHSGKIEVRNIEVRTGPAGGETPAVANSNELSNEWLDILPLVDQERDLRHRGGGRGIITLSVDENAYHINSGGNLHHGLISPVSVTGASEQERAAYQIQVVQEFLSRGKTYLALPVGPRFATVRLQRTDDGARLVILNVDADSSGDLKTIELPFDASNTVALDASVTTHGDHADIALTANEAAVWNWSGSIDEIQANPDVHYWNFDHPGKPALISFDTNVRVTSLRVRRTDVFAETSLYFDGLDDFVIAEDFKVNHEQSFTMELWVRNEGTPTTAEWETLEREVPLHHRTQAKIVSIGSLSIDQDHAANDTYQLKAGAGAGSEQGKWQGQIVGHELVPRVGDWMHLAVQWDGFHVSFFIDGIPQPESKRRFHRLNGEQEIRQFYAQNWHSFFSLVIGGASIKPTPEELIFPFRGSVREFRFSDGLKYSQPFQPTLRFANEADTRVLYHFEEGQGEILRDASGNGNDGKIIGASWSRNGSVGAKSSQTEPTNPATSQFELKFSKQDVVEVPSLKLDSSKPVTIECFVTWKPDGSNPIFAGVPDGFRLGQMSVDHGVFRLFENNHQPPLAGAGPFPDPVQRLHLAGVYTGQEVLCFRNGHLIDRKSTDGVKLLPMQRSFQIGGDFVGRIGPVRVSSNARYTEDFAPAESIAVDGEILALYDMSAGAGDLLKDASGNGHHGKIVGAEWVRWKPASSSQGASRDREAASWILELEGTFATLPPENFRQLREEDFFREQSEIPDHDFAISFVRINSRRVDDAALENLRQLTSLTRLEINDSAVSGTGARFLTGASLQSLALGNGVRTNRLTRAGMQEIVKLQSLTSLAFLGYDMTAETLELLPQLKNLENLNLYACGMDDEHVAMLPVLPDLKSLNISSAKQSESSVERLGQFRSLTNLFCNLPSDAALQLSRALPNCVIKNNDSGKDGPEFLRNGQRMK